MIDLRFLHTKDKWLLALIGSTQYVHGKTRLQKYGILVHKEILKNEDFFDDWRPDNFGGYSQQLVLSVKKLERRSYVRVSEVVNAFGEPVNRYELTEKGKGVKEEWTKRFPILFQKIRDITSYYFDKKLSVLLDDVYQKYPELTLKSKIRAEVNKIHTNNHSFLSPEYEIRTENENELPVFSKIPSSEHVFNDEDFRKKLALSIGLDVVPNLDPSSFERIKGILSRKIETKDFDSVELVKEVRGC